MTRARTSTLLVADATWSGKAYVVCIRNISRFGAFIQSDNLPSVGEEVVLRREGNATSGQVVWVKDEAFGLKFSTPVTESAWLADETDERLEQNISHMLDDQDRLCVLQTRLSEELNYISRIADAVSDVLVQDPVFRRRHEILLQELSISQQMLCELANIINAGLSVSGVEEHATGPMKNRILR